MNSIFRIHLELATTVWGSQSQNLSHRFSWWLGYRYDVLLAVDPSIFPSTGGFACERTCMNRMNLRKRLLNCHLEGKINREDMYRSLFFPVGIPMYRHWWSIDTVRAHLWIFHVLVWDLKFLPLIRIVRPQLCQYPYFSLMAGPQTHHQQVEEILWSTTVILVHWILLV